MHCVYIFEIVASLITAQSHVNRAVGVGEAGTARASPLFAPDFLVSYQTYPTEQHMQPSSSVTAPGPP